MKNENKTHRETKTHKRDKINIGRTIMTIDRTRRKRAMAMKTFGRTVITIKNTVLMITKNIRSIKGTIRKYKKGKIKTYMKEKRTIRETSKGNNDN